MPRSTLVVRRAVLAAVALIFAMLFAHPASAQLRERIKNKVVDDVATQMVGEIQNDSCPEFEAMLRQRKSGDSSSNKTRSMMKSDPAMRERFINKVAGPLLNKMIDCDLLPGK
jgi:type III secretory pathway component EscR